MKPFARACCCTLTKNNASGVGYSDVQPSIECHDITVETIWQAILTNNVYSNSQLQFRLTRNLSFSSGHYLFTVILDFMVMFHWRHADEIYDINHPSLGWRLRLMRSGWYFRFSYCRICWISLTVKTAIFFTLVLYSGNNWPADCSIHIICWWQHVLLPAYFGGVIGSISWPPLPTRLRLNNATCNGFIQMGFGAIVALRVPISPYMANVMGWQLLPDGGGLLYCKSIPIITRLC